MLTMTSSRSLNSEEDHQANFAVPCWFWGLCLLFVYHAGLSQFNSSLIVFSSTEDTSLERAECTPVYRKSNKSNTSVQYEL